MLKTDILTAIDQQICQLNKEISDIQNQKNSRNCVSAFFNSFMCLFHNELEIKHAKLGALNDLYDKVNKNSFQYVHDFDTYTFCANQTKYSANRGLVFSGFFNRTEKLFNLVRSFLIEQKKVQATNRANSLQHNKL